MKRVPNVGWAFLGLAILIYVVYLLNRGVYVGSTVRLSMAPIEVMALEKGRQLTAAEETEPMPQLTDAQVIALAEAQGRTAELNFIKMCKYLHFTGISIGLGFDAMKRVSSVDPSTLFCLPLGNSN